MFSQQPTILFVDDQRAELDSLSALLSQGGYRVLSESDADVARDYLTRQQRIDLLLSKMHLNGNGAGYRLLQAWKQVQPATPVVAITPSDDVESAVKAMRMGASDCIAQPVDPETMQTVLARCLASLPSAQTHSQKQPTAGGQLGIVGNSPVMRSLMDQVRRSAPTNSAVLLTGETGTGKEVLASAIHQLSRRADGPLVAVNVAAVPNTLIESELFGHVKGAFTDALEDRVGRFEAAEGGTLFIDEIGDLERPLQAKLLRVLENRVVNRVGSNEDIRVDARVVAATSRDLLRLVSNGQFRADLFYRLNVIHLKVPALRDRREDILPLTRHFLDHLGAETGRGQIAVSPELERYLVECDWPGNVRQLRNTLESMVVMSRGNTLTPADMPHALSTDVSGDAEPRLQLAGIAITELERLAITQTLEQCGGNRSRAARKLGISVRTLQRKLHTWDSQSGSRTTPPPLADEWKSRALLPV
jgi:DNA-binding NtrC family response regulator